MSEKIIIKKECLEYFRIAFHYVKDITEKITKELDETEEDYTFNSPLWGVEITLSEDEVYKLKLVLEKK